MELDLPPVSKCEKCKVVAQWRSVAELDDERQLILAGRTKGQVVVSCEIRMEVELTKPSNLALSIPESPMRTTCNRLGRVTRYSEKAVTRSVPRHALVRSSFR
jgi:hypothetical protein